MQQLSQSRPQVTARCSSSPTRAQPSGAAASGAREPSRDPLSHPEEAEAEAEAAAAPAPRLLLLPAAEDDAAPPPLALAAGRLAPPAAVVAPAPAAPAAASSSLERGRSRMLMCMSPVIRRCARAAKSLNGFVALPWALEDSSRTRSSMHCTPHEPGGCQRRAHRGAHGLRRRQHRAGGVSAACTPIQPDGPRWAWASADLLLIVVRGLR